MRSNMKKILLVSLLAAFGVTACDDIEARPNNDGNSDTTSVLAFMDDVYGNNYESINDKIHGDVASDTLDDILYTYSVSIVAPFNRNVANIYAKKITINGNPVNGSDLLTLEDVYNNSSKVAEFVSQYKAYAVKDANGNEDTAKELEYIKARYEAIERSIAKKMYNKVSSALEEHKFNEKHFLIDLYNNGGKVEYPYNLTSGYTIDQLLLPDVEPENVFTAGYLHKAFYSSDHNTYIEDELIPDIYRDILVQQYIFEAQDNLLGSSYARKVNIVSFSYSDMDTSLYAEKLVKGFVTKFLLKSNSNVSVLDNFKLLSSVWNGEFMNGTDAEIVASDEWKLLKEIGLVGDTVEKNTYVDQAADGKFFIKGSAYGELVEDYAKYNVNPAKSTATRDYTGGNTHVKEIGFEHESNEIKLVDHTTSGWFVKSNSEVSSLPDSIKNRLYNLSVATGVNNDGKSATLTYSETDGWKDSEDNKFVTKFENSYFLRQGTRKANAEEYEDIIFNDTSSHTYYIINVEGAVSPNYMTNCDDYATRIAVAELLSSSDSNISLAKKYWVEKCDIQYHDQSVYDYFESLFPELFED